MSFCCNYFEKRASKGYKKKGEAKRLRYRDRKARQIFPLSE